MRDLSVDLVRSNQSFRAYWLGQSIAGAGHQVTILALPLVSAITLGAGPAAVGAVATAATLPYLLFSLVLGHVLEGKNQKKIMIPADLVQAGLLLLIPIAWVFGWLSVPLLVVIAFLTGTAAVAFGISGFSYLPALVEQRELPAANRAIQGTRTITEIGGPGMAGLLLGWLAPPVVLFVDALGYLASAVGISRSKPLNHAQPKVTTETTKPKLLTGIKILFTNPYLRALTVHAALFNLAEQIFILNLILWAVQQQDVPPVAYGLALSAAGIGGLLGTITALRLADRFGLGKAFAASLVLSCGAPLAAGIWPHEGIMLAVVIGAVMLTVGIGLGNANVYSLSLRQTVIPKDQLSRSAGAYTQLMYGTIPIGAALAGLIGSTISVRAGVIIGATGMLLSALPMLTRRLVSLRTLEAAV